MALTYLKFHVDYGSQSLSCHSFYRIYTKTIPLPIIHVSLYKTSQFDKLLKLIDAHKIIVFTVYLLRLPSSRCVAHADNNK